LSSAKKVLDEIKLLVAFLDLIENFDETTKQLFFKKIRFQRLTVVCHNLLPHFRKIIFFLNIFFGVPHLATCIFLFFYNEPELGVEIYPGMALTPLSSSIIQGSNPRPSDREPSALPLDHSFR